MTKPKVFVVTQAPPDVTGDNYSRLERSGCELVTGDPAWLMAPGDGGGAISRVAADCDAIMSTSNPKSPITRDIIRSSETLRIVAKYTIGVDDVDVEAASELGVLVTHAPTEANWGGVAEGTVAAMLTILKRVREKDNHMRSGGWRDDKLLGTYAGYRGEDAYSGITIGLVGFGRIGTRVADLMRPWEMRVLACDPYVPESKFGEHGAVPVDLNTVLRESDVVSLHVVLNRETWHLIGANEIAMMKPSAVLINTSRGSVVHEEALVKALQEGAIEAAVLDVFEEEPLPDTNILRSLGDRVLLSPHMVSANVGTGLRPGVVWATDSVLSALKGEVPDHVFNPGTIPQWRERFENTALI